jgi:hypothetical protein
MTSERSETSKTKLLSDLEKDSETLRQMAETLATLSLDMHFVSVYEEQQTASVAKVSGIWMEISCVDLSDNWYQLRIRRWGRGSQPARRRLW